MKKNKFFEKISKFLNKDLEERVSAIETKTEKISSLEEKVDKIIKQLTPEKIQAVKNPSLVKSPDGRFQIRVEKLSTQGKDFITLHISLPILEGDENLFHFDFPKKVDSGLFRECPKYLDKLLSEIYFLQMCSKVIFKPFEISIQKTGAVNWDPFLPKILKMIFDFLDKKYPPVPATDEQISKIRSHIINSKDEVRSFTKKLLLYLLEKSKYVIEPVCLTLRESDGLSYDFIESVAKDLCILRSSGASTEINSFTSELGLSYDFTCHFGFYDKKGIWNSEKQIGFEKGKDELAYTFLFSPINYRNDGAKRLPFSLIEIEAVSLS